MKKVIIGLSLILALATFSYAGWVNGYLRSDGTYVQGYYRSDPNDTVKDNYSYKGNINPYTGEIGTNYYRDSPSSDYYEYIPKVKSWWNYEYTPEPTKVKSYWDSDDSDYDDSDYDDSDSDDWDFEE